MTAGFYRPARDKGAAEVFVDQVRRELDRLDVSARDDRAQDELDVFLHGGTVPPWPIPRPDPGCDDCDGCGRICSCHGLPATFCRVAGTEPCACLRRARRAVGLEELDRHPTTALDQAAQPVSWGDRAGRPTTTQGAARA